MRVRGWVAVGTALLISCSFAEAEPARTAKKKKPALPAATPKPAPKPTPDPEEKKTDVAESPKAERAPAASIEPEELAEFSAQPPGVQELFRAALALTKQNLTYAFGSDDPAKGGMDCSGTIFRVLMDQGFAGVPRDSSGQYSWVRKNGRFFSVVSKTADGFEFAEMLPGDLLFWTGTYETGRDIPISHVMLYLGHEKKSGKRVMFGASDGRSYAGVQRWGVSVFDFKMPKFDPAKPEKRVDFVGYGRIPGLREKETAPPIATTPPGEKPPAEPVETKPVRKKSTPKKSR